MLKPICTLLYHLWKQASPCNVRLKAEFATEAASLFISIPQTWIFLIQWIGWRKLGKLAWNELLDHSSLIFPLLLAPFFFFAFLYFQADLSDILSGFILHPLFPPPSLSIMMNLSIRNWSDRAEFAGKTTNNGLSSLSSYICDRPRICLPGLQKISLQNMTDWSNSLSSIRQKEYAYSK